MKAVVKTRLDEEILMPGEVKQAIVQVLFSTWTLIAEDGYELEINGHRYHVVGVDETSAYVTVQVRRKVE